MYLESSDWGWLSTMVYLPHSSTFTFGLKKFKIEAFILNDLKDATGHRNY